MWALLTPRAWCCVILGIDADLGCFQQVFRFPTVVNLRKLMGADLSGFET